MLKSPKHETAWKELFMQQYGKDPDSLGLDTLEKAIQASSPNEYTNPFQMAVPQSTIPGI